MFGTPHPHVARSGRIDCIPHYCSRQRVRQLALVVLLLFGLVSAWFTSPVLAAPDVTVRVTVERLKDLGCAEGYAPDPFPGCLGDPDFYAFVFIDGERLETPTIEDQKEPTPNWELSKSVDITKVSIPIQISVRDEDGGLRDDDDDMDLTPGPGNNLNLVLTLKPCGVSLDLSGSCGVSLFSSGTGGDHAEIQLRVEVDLPPSAPGLRVACTHSPIWPQATDAVTFTASALDGELAAKYVDSVELFVNDAGTPVHSGPGNPPVASVIRGPFLNGTIISYRCHVKDGAADIWSSWQQVLVGTPTQGRVVPIISTGPRSGRIDIVFIAARGSYPTGARDQNFLNGVRDVITNAYYREDVFLRNQDKFNFWIALDPGDADGTAANCTKLEPPGNWDDDYTFAETGVVLHANTFRDCAQRSLRVFSSEPTSPRTVLHETGHSPFGLADEYCNDSACDSPFFQNGPFPNLYDNVGDCMDDPLRLTSDACQELKNSTKSTGWFRLDPVSTVNNDLMVNNAAPQPADVRRIEWLLDQCRSARC